jgi:lipid-A-disaccharide synthase
MADERTLLLVAGDPSGDMHGGRLMRELKARDPGLKLAAVGGPRMREEADEFLEDLASRGMTGFIEPLKALPFFAKLLGRLKSFMLHRKPAGLICIDYYGFNRRVLGAAKETGVPAYYFISPQVWASRPGRVETLRGLVRRMLVIFPFEEEVYGKARVPCTYVGHPLLDAMPPARPAAPLKAPLTVGLLPGSRASEVKRHLPVFLAAFAEFRRHFPKSRAIVFASSSLSDDFYRKRIHDRELELVRETDYRERGRLDVCLSSSGTATLENALLGVPMVVVYKMSWPTYAIARALITVKQIAMVNILAGKPLAPELIQAEATPRKIARAAVGLLEDPVRYQELRRELAGLRSKLGTPGAAGRAADEILKGLAAAEPAPC